MKILLSAYLDNNLGDDLMIELLVEKFPDIQFTLYTDNSVVIESFVDINNLEVLTGNIYKKKVTGYDGFIKIGGSMFIANRISHYWQRIKEIKLLNSLKKENIWRVAIGSNYGPLSSIGNKLIKCELKKYNLLTVRDKESFDYLKTIRKIQSFYKFSDVVFTLNNKNNEEIKNKKILGISPYRSSNRAINQVEYHSLAKIADNYIESTNGKVKLFAFDTENENDLSACFHVKNMVKNSNNIEIIPYLGNRVEVLSELNQCTEFLAVRFHAAVLSEIFNIPYFAISYSNKMRNFINEKGSNNGIITIEEISNNIEYISKSLIAHENLINSSDNHFDSVGHFNILEKFIDLERKKN